jgi:hypothetical protein
MSVDGKEIEGHNLLRLGLKRIPNPDYEQHPAYGKLFGRPSWSVRISALKRLAPYLKMEASMKLRESWRFMRRSDAGAEDSTQPLQKLKRDGAMAIQLSVDEMNGILKASAEFVNALEASRREKGAGKRTFADNVLNLTEERAPELYSGLKQSFENHDIIRMAGLYLGLPVSIRAVVLQITDADDTHWRNHFPDINHPDPATSYMHIDSSLKWMKCIIYLNEVGEGNGPFSYAVGSNNLKVSMLENIIRKANDKSRLDKCDPQMRQLFSALPKVLQKKAEFGNDLLDDTPQAQALLACERRFTSRDGNLILFDNNGIHRGGMVVEGKRQILQIQLEPRLNG